MEKPMVVQKEMSRAASLGLPTADWSAIPLESGLVATKALNSEIHSASR